MRHEDQDGDAAAHGYWAQMIAVKERASEDEVTLRDVIHSMSRQVNQLIAAFEVGQTIDAEQLVLKAEQLTTNIRLCQQLYPRPAAVASRELVGV